MYVRAPEQDDDFRACYVQLYPRLTAYLWTLTRNQEVAHDLSQETFARLFDRWRSVDDPDAYAYRVATNLVHRSWRRRDLEARVLRRYRPEPVPDAAEGVAIRQVVDGLPRRYREVVLLHYYADLGLQDVAVALGRPVGTVKRQLSEARALLATAIEGARS